VEASGFFDGVAKGEGISYHQIALWVEVNPLKIPEFEVVEIHSEICAGQSNGVFTPGKSYFIGGVEQRTV
jgi:hypothetical protein